MGSKPIRVTISFDEAKEKDILEVAQSLADSHKLGPLASNLIRIAYDNNPAIIKNMSGVDVKTKRTEFFEKAANMIKEQDEKIDAIYSMCTELYGLGRMNKAIGLESKADGLIMSQFVLQRQQDKIKQLLGDGEFSHVYDSERLLNEKGKADSIMEYILTVYSDMIAEVKPLLFKEIEIPVTGVVMQTAPIQAVAVPQKPSASRQELSGGDEYIDLPEKPVQTKKDPSTLETPTGEAANFLMEMMDDM